VTAEEAERVTVARTSKLGGLVMVLSMTTAATVGGEASSEQSGMKMFRVQEQPTS
jgi:hypothetical protein